MLAVAKVRVFSLSSYIDVSLKLARYEEDENGIIVATVPEASGFFAQGENYEEARSNLQEVIEGNVLLALQLGWEIPSIPDVDIVERDVETHSP